MGKYLKMRINKGGQAKSKPDWKPRLKWKFVKETGSYSVRVGNLGWTVIDKRGRVSLLRNNCLNFGTMNFGFVRDVATAMQVAELLSHQANVVEEPTDLEINSRQLEWKQVGVYILETSHKCVQWTIDSSGVGYQLSASSTVTWEITDYGHLITLESAKQIADLITFG